MKKKKKKQINNISAKIEIKENLDKNISSIEIKKEITNEKPLQAIKKVQDNNKLDVENIFNQITSNQILDNVEN